MYRNDESESEQYESELVQELMEISTEAELDRFLGKLARSVVRGASKFVKSPIGKALGGVLKSVAKTALPMVGGALGSFVLPGVGTAIGSKLGSMAGGLLEAGELERMDEAEAEYEMARRYVAFARGAYRNAARAPLGTPTRAVVRAAAVSSARRHAPALLRSRPARRGRRSYVVYEPLPWMPVPGDGWAGSSADDRDRSDSDGTDSGGYGDDMTDGPADEAGSGTGGRNRGRWVRRGTRVVLHGVV